MVLYISVEVSKEHGGVYQDNITKVGQQSRGAPVSRTLVHLRVLKKQLTMTTEET